jgi:hypothetical protein
MLERHIVRNSIVVVSVKHTLCHAGHFLAIVGAQVVLPTLEIAVEATCLVGEAESPVRGDTGELTGDADFKVW